MRRLRNLLQRFGSDLLLLATLVIELILEQLKQNFFFVCEGFGDVAEHLLAFIDLVERAMGAECQDNFLGDSLVVERARCGRDHLVQCRTEAPAPHIDLHVVVVGLVHFLAFPLNAAAVIRRFISRVNTSCFTVARYHADVGTVYLSLGSNLGDKARNLRLALEHLKAHVTVDLMSKVYESEPMYVTDQPRFYNMVVRGETGLEPLDLLSTVKAIEQDMGRMPSSHNQPRPIDIDILLYDDVVLETADLTIPHPRMHERAFVMMPLEEIASFHVHPKLRRPIIDLWDDIGHRFDTLWEAKEQL